MPQDQHFMHHAIAIANMAIGTTAPNPTVACVIVKDGKIIASAHTAKNGRPHAETIALSDAGENADGATAYVTLEPCSHYGKTSPCALALIESGVKRVVIATTDPFPQVNGNGITMLKDAGIEVTTGIYEKEARQQNEGFFSIQEKKRPFVTLKTATSFDGKIALKDGTSKWITGEQSRSYVHLMRARNDAIVTGIATVIADDPAFTCRLPGMGDRSPVRVILDTNLSIPTTCQLVQTANITPSWVVTLEKTITSQPDKVKFLEESGVKLIAVRPASNGKICMDDAMFQLGKNGINTIMIEAGKSINTAALHLGLVDRIAWFRAPLIIGNEGIPAFSNMQLQTLVDASNFTIVSSRNIGNDTLQILDSYKL